jgi:hypothetical protein
MRHVILVVVAAVTVSLAISHLDSHEQEIIRMRELRIDAGVESDQDTEDIEI